ncbi:MAG TPA: hypothetical protein VHF07_00495, partial [Nitrospiraceae bacterium]|nr:hypothetical protein [Nitrospiraceae bacterium]
MPSALLALGVIILTLYCSTTQPAMAQQADAEVLAAQAALAYNEHRYEEGLTLLKKALAFDPRNQ